MNYDALKVHRFIGWIIPLSGLRSNPQAAPAWGQERPEKYYK